MDESRLGSLVKWGLGAVGLGAVAVAFTVRPYGIWIALVILILFLLLFGGYFLWRRIQDRRQRQKFASALENQSASAPKSISDPNKRAELDRLRQKFQKGMQEFRSRGKDIYKLPWYVFIGESGSGKTESIRHSNIEFPPGLQDEFQGSGGTVNMDWWFTNRAILLDTAGSMIFRETRADESPEWREFLRLLKKARPHCPVNGLFLVLSIESLIKDSADTIAQKASRLHQQLDLIQKALDVRFPVYLLVTKSDLLTGFREFFDSIEDPLLQHQIFGWSNPDPLDSHFRPDLVEQHLKSISEQLRRRRLALLRDATSQPAVRSGDTAQFFAAPSGQGPGGRRRMDEVDALFALPESIMRLAPRLRRYLETIFVAGEWSAKPVFLRGIYFTSSMREGKALDEAIALATGVSLDQLPEDRSWDKNRAFFLRDLFLEKVFRESGLVTRATNTLKMLRTRQLAIFGTAGVALLLLVLFAWLGGRNLNRSVRTESAYWQAGTNNWKDGFWSPIVRALDSSHFEDAGTNLVEGVRNLTVVQYHQELKSKTDKDLSVGLVFTPISWFTRGTKDRAPAQRVLFESSVLKPLVLQTRARIIQTNSPPSDPAAVARHRDALLSLMKLEADGLASGGTLPADSGEPQKYLGTFLSYLTDRDRQPDTNLVNVFSGTYSKAAVKENRGQWPPVSLLGGNTLASNLAIRIGLEKFDQASRNAQTDIDEDLARLNALVEKLWDYHQREQAWRTNLADSCLTLVQTLQPIRTNINATLALLHSATNFGTGPLTNVGSRYFALQAAASNASVASLQVPVKKIVLGLPELKKTGGLFGEIQDELNRYAARAAGTVRSSYDRWSGTMTILDREQLALVSGKPAYEARWELYSAACALATTPVSVSTNDLGERWARYVDLKSKADQFRNRITAYNGPLAEAATNACDRIAGEAEQKLKGQFVARYVEVAKAKLTELAAGIWDAGDVARDREWFEKIESDLAADKAIGDQVAKLEPVRPALNDSKKRVLENIDRYVRGQLGFPVLPEPAKPMNADGLGESRKLLAAVQRELSSPVWTNFPGGPEALAKLQGNLAGYAGILNSLLNRDNSIAEWEISIPPFENLAESDKGVVSALRYVRLTDGAARREEDLTRPDNAVLGKGTLDRGITLSFRKELGKDDSLKEEKLPAWWFPRLIRNGRAEMIESGPKWKVRIALEDAAQGLKGDAVFEMKLLNNLSLPKREDWPR